MPGVPRRATGGQQPATTPSPPTPAHRDGIAAHQNPQPLAGYDKRRPASAPSGPELAHSIRAPANDHELLKDFAGALPS